MTGAPRGVDERLARVALSQLSEPGWPKLSRMTEELGAVDLYAALLAERDPGGLRTDLAVRLAESDPVRDLERATRLGIRFVIPSDDEWPTQLADLAHAEPLQERGGVPIGLWVKGPLPLSELTGSVAVVGSRSATSYGADAAAEVAAAAARAGLTGRLGGGLRHRPGGPPRCPGHARKLRRRPRLRRRSRLSRGPQDPARPPRGRARRDLRGSAGLGADPDPVPLPQPADRGADPRDRGGRGRRTQRCAEHRQLGHPAQPSPHGCPRAGHERPVAGRPPADPHRRGNTGHQRAGRARAGRSGGGARASRSHAAP